MSDGARRVLVTGASAGIGRACAEGLHAAGWVVTGASRRGTTSGGWAGLVMDVDDDDSVRSGVAGMLAGAGRIDALVASAGWGLAGAVERCTIGEAKAQLETNFWGCVRVLQQVLPAMRAQRGGRIVLMSSLGGVIGIPFQAFYSASKFAVEGLGEALAYEVAPFDVHVTLVEPGNVKTDFTASRRIAQAAGGDPVYGAAVTKAVGLMERDEANGVPAADVAVVVRGYGTTRFLSDDTLRNGQQAALAADVITLMDALGVGKAILAGFDWGPGRLREVPAREFSKLIWRLASPKWVFDDATFARSGAAFDNPDHVAIVIHNYRWRLGLAAGESQYDELERRLAGFPAIAVPTITLEGDANGAPHPEASAYASKFTGKYEHRVVEGGIGHNLPQEAPQAFAEAIIDAGRY